jgi:IS30 family transposase
MAGEQGDRQRRPSITITVRNTNRLPRFWFEKGIDLMTWRAAGLRRVQDTLNRRPRPTLDYRTPAEASTNSS